MKVPCVVVVVMLCWWFALAVCRGDVVYLKNGKHLEGEISAKSDASTVWIDVQGGMVGIPAREVEKIVSDDIPAVSVADSLPGRETKTAAATGLFMVAINPMVELDFISREALYELRRRYVTEHPELLAGAYQPSEKVFGQVIGGRPWWGTEGLSRYGPGEKSIAGLSEESRFIANPFLLVGIDAGFVQVAGDGWPAAEPVCPLPERLSWDTRRKMVSVVYDMTDYWRARFNDRRQGRVTCKLVAYNALDLGYNYLSVDPQECVNIMCPPQAQAAMLNDQYLHIGGSCGYPGGCNNMSGFRYEFQISDLPALMRVKLWKTKPLSVDSAPDMRVEIKMR